MSEKCENCYKLQEKLDYMQKHYNNELQRVLTKLCKVKTYIEETVKADKPTMGGLKRSYNKRFELIQQALEVINE